MDKQAYATILDAVSEGVVTFDADSKIVYRNQYSAKIFGEDKVKLGRRFDELLMEAGVESNSLQSIFDALKDKEEYSSDISVSAEDRKIGWFRLRIQPVQDGKGDTVYFSAFMSDISSLKNVEAQYGDLEKQYQFIFENALAGIIIHGPDSKIKQANPMAIEMFGLDPAAVIDKAAADSEWGFLRSDGSPMPSSELPFVRALAERGTVRGVTVGRRNPRDGKINWALSNAFVATNDQNEVSSVLVSFADVTRLIESEIEARLYRERFELAARATQDVVFEWNIETGAFFANEAFKVVYGYAPPEVMGPENLDARNAIDEYQNIVRDVTLEAIASGKERFSLNHMIRRDDGSVGHIVIRAFIARNPQGKATRVIGTSTDIGQLNAALLALEESETRFRIIADTVSDVLWDHNIDTGESWVTPDWHKRLGISVDKIEFQQNHWMKQVDPADFDRLASSYQSALESGSPTWEIEYQMIGGDGQKIDVSVKASIIRHPNGKPCRVLGNLRDITAKKREQEGYTRARALEAVGRLTGGVAHDFNNLLMIIQGNAELLEMSDLSADDAESVSLISAAAQNAATLTRRLLAFSGGTQFDTTRIGIAGLFDNIGPLLRAALPESIELSIRIAEDIWDADGDANSLQQAIVNLAMNSRDAMPNGGNVTIICGNVVVEEGTAPPTTRLKPGQYVVLCVQDNGKGMPDAVLSKVFEPYFTSKEFGQGTGLGLSTVYGFATQSGGDVAIASGADMGTTVELYIPAFRADLETTLGADMDNRPAVPASLSRILIVEDQPEVRRHVEKALLRLGYSVIAVDDASSALAMLKGEHTFDLLFTDIVMPGGMNGPELATAAKQIAPNIKVLYTSGYPAAAFEQIGLEDQSGINVLQKPYRNAQLKEAIARALVD